MLQVFLHPSTKKTLQSLLWEHAVVYDVYHKFEDDLVIAEEIAKLFPCLYGQPSVSLVPDDSGDVTMNQSLKIGVVLSGGQAPGGHNVISGIFGEIIVEKFMSVHYCGFFSFLF